MVNKLRSFWGTFFNTLSHTLKTELESCLQIAIFGALELNLNLHNKQLDMIVASCMKEDPILLEVI